MKPPRPVDSSEWARAVCNQLFRGRTTRILRRQSTEDHIRAALVLFSREQLSAYDQRLREDMASIREIEAQRLALVAETSNAEKARQQARQRRYEEEATLLRFKAAEATAALIRGERRGLPTTEEINAATGLERVYLETRVRLRQNLDQPTNVVVSALPIPDPPRPWWRRLFAAAQ